jgi:hypothetical protein
VKRFEDPPLLMHKRCASFAKKIQRTYNMRHFILGTVLVLSSCSAKKNIEEDKTNTDTVGVTKSVVAEQIDFPLDSLLSFDSETELKKVFANNIKRSIGYYPEGIGEYPNTLLFPGTNNRVEFVWLDDSISFSSLVYINIAGQETDWKTEEGITLGTKLKDLEKLNHKPFTFYGFGWDYGGSATWDNGRLQERKIFVSLEYPGDSMPTEFEGLLGDHEIRSNSELAQKANPVVVEITMRR